MSDRAPVVIVDVGLGNLRSVERALHAALDADTPLVTTRDPGPIRDARVVVFPGQGAFGDCATALARDGGALGRALRDRVESDRPYLGICLGLQVLFGSSDEAPGKGGLGVFEGAVRRFREGARDADGALLKVPHMGWNRAHPVNAGALWMPRDDWYYFVHSYRVEPVDRSLVAAETVHGEGFVSAVARGRLLAVQFHPEKSQRAGLALLRRFVEAHP